MREPFQPATLLVVGDDQTRRAALVAALAPLWPVEEASCDALRGGVPGRPSLVVLHSAGAESEAGRVASAIERIVGVGAALLLVTDAAAKAPPRQDPGSGSSATGAAVLVAPRDVELVAAVAGRLARLDERRKVRAFESFFIRGGDPFCMLDLEGRVLRVNAAFAAVFGDGEREGLIGRPLIELVHPDDRAAATGALCDAGAERRGVDVRFRDREGLYHPFAATVSPAREPALVHVTLRESTAARRAEERFRLVARATTDAIWERDLATNQTWWGDGLYAQFGWAGDEMTHESWIGCLHPEDRERVLALVERNKVGAPAWAIEYRFRRKNGTYAVVLDQGFALMDPAGRPVQILGSLCDVTEKRRAERVMREQATLLDKARDAIIVRDVDGRITYWNSAAERMYGHSAAEATGKNIAQLITKDPLQIQRAEAILLRQGEWTGELTQRTKDGRELLVEARWTLVRDDMGRPQSVFAIDTDITEKKKLESQFLRIQRMESIGTLAGGIAHDLNNILTPILISTEFLRAPCSGDSEAEEALAAIESSSRRAADMVQQILSFARGVDGHRLRVRPSTLILAIAKIARETFGKAIRVQAEADEGSGLTVSGDPTQLHQVLLNLSVNARDAMPEGGELRISSSGATIDQGYAALNPEARPGRYVVFKASDSGVGISEELREKIFEPFFTTKEIGRGTGLGLSTALAIVRSHGGFITVYSEPGRGSTFKVYLPAAESDGAEEAARAEPPELPRGSGELVLVVDDEAAIRRVTKRTLETHGYRVLTADNGAAAVAAYARHQGEISVVLTDMAMPVMDGAAMIHALKNLDPTVRIVAASGLATNGAMAKAANAGVKSFLQKPYTADTMLTTLRDVLREGEHL